MFTEQGILDYINKQMKANKDHLEFTEKRLGRDWVIENSEIEYYQGANTALFEMASAFGIIDDGQFIESIEKEF